MVEVWNVFWDWCVGGALMAWGGGVPVAGFGFGVLGWWYERNRAGSLGWLRWGKVGRWGLEVGQRAGQAGQGHHGRQVRQAL